MNKSLSSFFGKRALTTADEAPLVPSVVDRHCFFVDRRMKNVTSF